MELQAVTGQRYIGAEAVRLDGEGTIPGLAALPAPSQAARGRQKDFLFIHLTLGGRPVDIHVLTQDVVDSISTLFYETPGSVTAALKKAIIQSNQQLLRYNLSGAGVPREGALTCAVLRGEELFVVQAGESFALLGHNFGIERLPPEPPAKVTPLGRTAGLDLRYTHNWLLPGDMLLLADPRLAHLPTSAFEPALIDVDVEDGLAELVEIAGDDTARVLMVEFTDEAPGHFPDSRGSQSTGVSRQLPPPTAAPMREGGSYPADESTGAGDARTGAGFDVEVAETKARKATSRAAMGLSGLTAWFADLLTLLHSPDSDSSESESWAIPAFLAIIIPIIVAAIVAGVYVQRGNVLRLSDIQSEMRQKIVEANGSEEATHAELLYEETIALAAEAEDLRPNDPEIAMLREEAVAGLDEIAGIARLRGILLYSYGEEANLASITLDGASEDALFVLDEPGNRVYRLQTDVSPDSVTLANPETILFGEQVIGSHVTGQMMDTMWRPQGSNTGRDGLAALDSRGALVTYYPNLGDARAVPLGLSSEWQQPSAITTFGERLYVLDPGAGRIWRYFPEGEGFIVSEGQQFVEFPDDADLGNVVDFGIVSRDGSVILLYANGGLRQYAGDTLMWSESELAQSGLDTPMTAPASLKIVGSGLNSSIFVLDPGSDRVLQFSLGGTFLAQYKASDELSRELFGRARDFVVLENPLRIFVVAEDDLYVVGQS
ncbi:MAG: hypothetical protein JSW55_16630 [Chloroflexota bacterium]|nr:MAG: hypothetical protein JSW55_16630 [Chloroflexota bacterium]